MHKHVFASIGAIALFASPAIAGDPLILDDAALDAVTAGDLGLPNGRIQFEGINNPGKDGTSVVCTEMGMCHSTWNRSNNAVFVLFLMDNPGRDTPPLGLEGPWAAGRVSPAIECINCP